MFNSKMKNLRKAIKDLRKAEADYHSAYEEVYYDEICGIRQVYPTQSEIDYMESFNVRKVMAEKGYSSNDLMVAAIVAFDIEVVRHNKLKYSCVTSMGYAPYRECSNEEYKELEEKYLRHKFRPYGKCGM